MLKTATAAALALVGVAVCLASCGGASAATAASPSVDSLGEQSTCKVAKDPLNPLIVEWPGTSKVELTTSSQFGIVVVSYVGCVLKVLSDCQAGGSYSMMSVTPVRDRITVADESDLYARLPLGVASLKSELKTAGRLDLEYVAVGQRAATQSPSALTGDCRGATHYVKAITVGAYSLDAIGHASGGAGGSFGENGVSASRREDVRRLGGAGNVTACEQANATGCDAILQLALAPLDGSQRQLGRAGPPAEVRESPHALAAATVTAANPLPPTTPPMQLGREATPTNSGAIVSAAGSPATTSAPSVRVPTAGRSSRPTITTMGAVTVVCVPKCTEIAIDGKSLGPGHIFHRPWPAGPVTVDLYSRDVHKQVQAVVPEGSTYDLRVPMNPPPKPPAKLPPNCDPPYTEGSDGRRQYKLECLQ